MTNFFTGGLYEDKIEYCRTAERNYTPMYNWYSKKLSLDDSYKGKKVLLTILKSMYTTNVYINGHFVKSAIESSTPIRCNITDYLKFDKNDEILIMVSDRAWLPSEVAGQTDIEKFQFISGIWDDVFLTVTSDTYVDKALFLPSYKDKKIEVKSIIQSLKPSEREICMGEISDSISLIIRIKEKKSGTIVATKKVRVSAEHGNNTSIKTSISVPDAHPWSPEDPFLYTGEIEVHSKDGRIIDCYSDNFGIRDFKVKGLFFNLNGQKYLLRGTNITLHRFFEDRECNNLPWDRKWVKKLIIDDPKALQWNAMRICVGLAPKFWYDLCDEYGIIIQNEWMYWQKHGWDEQIRKEYTDWVWSDGNHPSIVIWDCINENVNDYIGYHLIPELKKLDPTRLFDAGYMVDENSKDDIDEPHPYNYVHNVNTFNTDEQINKYFSEQPDKLGSLDYWRYHPGFIGFSVPQLVNEYGWAWLNRNGQPSYLTYWNYRYFVGENATAEQRRKFQAYWLQAETEWLRSERNLAGILSFCSLTNNGGKTGDWYINQIKDLEPSPAMKWFKHCFAPEAVFLDLVDTRYTKHNDVLVPGQYKAIHLVGVNDLSHGSNGKVNINIYDSDGKVVYSTKLDIYIPPYLKTELTETIKVPEVPGGYLITAEYTPDGQNKAIISRRYVKVGKAENYSYYEMEP